MFKYRPYIDIEETEKIHTLYEDPSIYIRYPFSKAVDGMEQPDGSEPGGLCSAVGHFRPDDPACDP